MGCPQVAAQLLLTQDSQEGAALAQTLCDLNRERQLIEQDIFAQCLSLLEEHPELAKDAIVLAGRNWHQGWWALWPPGWQSGSLSPPS